MIPSLHAASGFPFSDGLNAPGPSNGWPVSQQQLDRPRTADVVEPSENLGSQIGRLVRSGPDSSALGPVGENLIKSPSASRALQDLEAFVFGESKDSIQSGPQHAPNPLPSSPSSRLFVLPSLRLPIIPRSFHVPLSFSCPENFQITDGASPDLEMTLYASPFRIPCTQIELNPNIQPAYSATALQ